MFLHQGLDRRVGRGDWGGGGCCGRDPRLFSRFVLLLICGSDACVGLLERPTGGVVLFLFLS